MAFVRRRQAARVQPMREAVLVVEREEMRVSMVM